MREHKSDEGLDPYAGTRPTSFFKYRPFNVYTLRMLTNTEVYNSSPASFNDPLDCSPSIVNDLDLEELQSCFKEIYIQLRDGSDWRHEIRRIKTFVGEGLVENSPEHVAAYTDELVRNIGTIILSDLTRRGVLSLSSRWDSPLMWSHYADEHRGICIEYRPTAESSLSLKPICYGGSRGIKTSDLVKWRLGNDAAARDRIHHTYFYSKASDWEYEQEWRVVTTKSGTDHSLFRPTSILLGYRSDSAVAVVLSHLRSSLEGLTLYEIYPDADAYTLHRREMDWDLLRQMGVKTSIYLDFENYVGGTPPVYDELES